MSLLPVAVATKKRMIQLHLMVRSCVPSNCRETSDLMFFVPYIYLVDSEDLHIPDQDTY